MSRKKICILIIAVITVLIITAGFTLIDRNQIPEPASNLKAYKSDATEISLSWDKAKHSDGYEVYYSKVSEKKPDDDITSWGKATETKKEKIVVKELIPDEEYKFAILSYSNGKKDIRNYPTKKASVILEKTTVPNMAQVKVKAEAVSDSEIKISWEEVREVTSYKVLFAPTEQDEFLEIAKVKKTGLSYNHTGLFADTPYFYKVICVLEIGDKSFESKDSKIASAITASAEVEIASQEKAKSAEGSESSNQSLTVASSISSVSNSSNASNSSDSSKSTSSANTNKSATPAPSSGSNPNAGKVWKEAVYEKQWIETKAAWTEYRDIFEYHDVCKCGFVLSREGISYSAHVTSKMPDSAAHSSYKNNVPIKVGSEPIYHPAEGYEKTVVVREAGWY